MRRLSLFFSFCCCFLRLLFFLRLKWSYSSWLDHSGRLYRYSGMERLEEEVETTLGEPLKAWLRIAFEYRENREIIGCSALSNKYYWPWIEINENSALWQRNTYNPICSWFYEDISRQPCMGWTEMRLEVGGWCNNQMCGELEEWNKKGGGN